MHVHSCSRTHTHTDDGLRRCSLRLSLPIQLACSALTLPERLDLMTRWGRETETRGSEGEKEGRFEKEKKWREGGGKERTDERWQKKVEEEDEETRDGQLEGKRKPQCLVVGVWEKETNAGNTEKDKHEVVRWKKTVLPFTLLRRIE